MKKLLSALLCVMLVLTMMPGMAFAEGEAQQDSAVFVLKIENTDTSAAESTLLSSDFYNKNIELYVDGNKVIAFDVSLSGGGSGNVDINGPSDGIFQITPTAGGQKNLDVSCNGITRTFKLDIAEDDVNQSDNNTSANVEKRTVFSTSALLNESGQPDGPVDHAPIQTNWNVQINNGTEETIVQTRYIYVGTYENGVLTSLEPASNGVSLSYLLAVENNRPTFDTEDIGASLVKDSENAAKGNDCLYELQVVSSSYEYFTEGCARYDVTAANMGPVGNALINIVTDGQQGGDNPQGGGSQPEAGPVRLYDSQGNWISNNAVFLNEMTDGIFYFALVQDYMPDNIICKIEDKYLSMADGGYDRSKGLINIDPDNGIIKVSSVDAQDSANEQLIQNTGLADSNKQYKLYKAVVDNDTFKANTYLDTGYLDGWIHFAYEEEGVEVAYQTSDEIAIFSNDFQADLKMGEGSRNMYFAESATPEGPMSEMTLKMYEPLTSGENTVYLHYGNDITPERLTAWLTYEHRWENGTVTAYQKLPESALTLTQKNGYYEINMNAFYGHNDVVLQMKDAEESASVTLKKVVQYLYKTEGLAMAENVDDYLHQLNEAVIGTDSQYKNMLSEGFVNGEYTVRVHANKGNARTSNRPYNGGFYGMFLDVADENGLAAVECTGFDKNGEKVTSNLFYLISQNFYFQVYNPNGSLQEAAKLYQTGQNLQFSAVQGSYGVVEAAAVLAEYIYDEESGGYRAYVDNQHDAVAEALANLKEWADKNGYILSFMDTGLYYDIGVTPGEGYDDIWEFYELIDQIGTVELVTESLDKSGVIFGDDGQVGIRPSDDVSKGNWGKDHEFKDFTCTEGNDDAKKADEEYIRAFFGNEKESVLGVYDFKMTENETFKGMVDIYIPVPEGQDYRTCRIYWMHEGTPVPMPARYVDGYMVFTTSHFSEYVLASDPDLTSAVAPVSGFSLQWNGEYVLPGGTLYVKPGQLLNAELYLDGTVYEGKYPMADTFNEEMITSIGISPDGKMLECKLSKEAEEGDRCRIAIYYGDNNAQAAYFFVEALEPDPEITLQFDEEIVQGGEGFGMNGTAAVTILYGGEKIPQGYSVGTNGNSAVCTVSDNRDGTFTITSHGNGDCNIIVEYNGMQESFRWHVEGMEDADCNLQFVCGADTILPGGSITLAGHNKVLTGKILCNGSQLTSYNLQFGAPPEVTACTIEKNTDGTLTITTPEEDGFTDVTVTVMTDGKSYTGRFEIVTQTPERYVFQYHTMEPNGEGGYDGYGYGTLSVFKKWYQSKLMKFVITDQDMRRIDYEYFVAANPDNLKLLAFNRETGEYDIPISTEFSPFTIEEVAGSDGVLKITYNRFKDFYGPGYMLEYTGEDKYLDNEDGIPTDDKIFFWTRSVGEMVLWENFQKTGNLWFYNAKMDQFQEIKKDNECDVKQVGISFYKDLFGDGEEQIAVGSDTAMEIETDLGNIVLDNVVLGLIDNCDQDTTLNILEVDPEDEEYKEIASGLEDASYIIDMRLSHKDGNIQDFGDGKITIKLDYTLSEEGKADGKMPHVYYVDKRGEKHLVKCTYDAEKGTVSFDTNHFSVYEIEEAVPDETPGTGDGGSENEDGSGSDGSGDGGDSGAGGSEGGGGTGSSIPVVPSVPAVPSADPLPPAKSEASGAVGTYVDSTEYDEAEADEITAIIEQAKKDIDAAKTLEEIEAIEAAAKAEIDKIETAEEKAVIAEVEATRFTARSQKARLNGKKAVKVTWNVPEGMDFDGFDVFRSTKRYKGYGTKPFFTTTKTSYVNNKDLEAGKTYYYKVRAFKYVNDEKVYTEWSSKAWRTI